MFRLVIYGDNVTESPALDPELGYIQAMFDFEVAFWGDGKFDAITQYYMELMLIETAKGNVCKLKHMDT